jgi:hypothetical protein
MELKVQMEKLVAETESHLSRQTFSKEYIASTVAMLHKLGTEDALVWLFENESSNFNIDFLLCFPEIWSDFNKTNWDKIMRTVKRPEHLRMLMDERGYFDDITFLFRYIGIDVFEWIRSDTHLNNKSKVVIFNYFRTRTNSLTRDTSDDENYNEGIWADEKYCRGMRERLLQQSLLSSQDDNSPEKIREKLENFLKEYE